jgi:hypothetical protein
MSRRRARPASTPPPGARQTPHRSAADPLLSLRLRDRLDAHAPSAATTSATPEPDVSRRAGTRQPHPPWSALEASAAGATHACVASQTLPDKQSSTVVHDVAQAFPMHLNGAHGVLEPSGLPCVWSSVHVVESAGTQSFFPGSQRNFGAQSASLEHGALPHAVPAHTYGWHCTVSAGAQAPLPSHLAASVATPSVQLGGAQVTVADSNALQTSVRWPSHVVFEHGLLGEPWSHGARTVPCGAPVTGAHVPSAFLMSHASHCPVHTELQQNPSTQIPLSHESFVVHDVPFFPFGLHAPASHQASVAQSASVVHVVVHAPAAQRYAPHGVVPVTTQVPVPLQAWTSTALLAQSSATHAVPCA